MAPPSVAPPRFVATSSLVFRTASPPAAPPTSLARGDYCLRATCIVVDAEDQTTTVGRVVGYDTCPSVGAATEGACALHARAAGGTCGPAELVLMPHSRRECSGQVYWIEDGLAKPRRIV